LVWNGDFKIRFAGKFMFFLSLWKAVELVEESISLSIDVFLQIMGGFC
jgi:hypothetical protein